MANEIFTFQDKPNPSGGSIEYKKYKPDYIIFGGVIEKNKFNDIDLSNITSGDQMFYNNNCYGSLIKPNNNYEFLCQSDFNKSPFNDGKLTSAKSMFYNCGGLGGFLQHFDTKNITNFNYMLYAGNVNNASLSEMPIKQIGNTEYYTFPMNFSKAVTCNYMFGGPGVPGNGKTINNPIVLDFPNGKEFEQFIGGFTFNSPLYINISNPNKMAYMFQSNDYAKLYEEINIHLNTFSLSSSGNGVFKGTFSNANIKKIVLKVDNMPENLGPAQFANMFYGLNHPYSTPKLEYLDIRDFEFSKMGVAATYFITNSTLSEKAKACTIIVKNEVEKVFWQGPGFTDVRTAEEQEAATLDDFTLDQDIII